MPLRVSPYSHATIHPYLWGLLPDNERVVERWAREFDQSVDGQSGTGLAIDPGAGCLVSAVGSEAFAAK